MPYRRRLVLLLIVLGAVALPAVVLRAACVGRSCGSTGGGPARVPFCSLPAEVRAEIAAGFREGRSPDVIGVPNDAVVWGGTDDQRGVSPLWPTASGEPDLSVPLVFHGVGISRSAAIPPGTTLDAVAPTLWEVLHAQWNVPSVHPGKPIEGVAAGGPVPRLLLIVEYKGVGSRDLLSDTQEYPFLQSLLRDGAGTIKASTGSVPLDPAATMTTVATGGLPSSHGITGTWLRNSDNGKLARAYEKGSPLPVIATLEDDYDNALGERPLIGIVGTDPSDRALVGGDWYIGHDRDASAFVDPRRVPAAAERILKTGFGRDGTPDVLGVVMRDSVEHMDEQLHAVVDAGERVSGGRLTVVVTATGAAHGPSGDTSVRLARVAAPVNDAIPGTADAVDAIEPGGLFLNQDALTAAGVSSGVAVQAMLGEREPNGGRLFADAFPQFAVSFGKYCSG